MRWGVGVGVALVMALGVAGCTGGGSASNSGSAASGAVTTTTTATTTVTTPAAGPGLPSGPTGTPAGAPTLAEVDGVLAQVAARYRQQCEAGNQGGCALATNMQNTATQIRAWASSCQAGDQSACGLYTQNARAVMMMPSLMAGQARPGGGGNGMGPAPQSAPPMGGAGDGGSRQLSQASAQQIQAAANILRRVITLAGQSCEQGNEEACGRQQRLSGVQRQLYGLFQQCSQGDQAACQQHDAIVAQILQAAQQQQQGSGGQGAPAPSGGSGWQQR